MGKKEEQARNADQARRTHMDWTLRSGTEQEMPSQAQGLGSDGLQLVRRWVVALKASLSSSRASPASKGKTDEKEKHALTVARGLQNVNTVRGEGHGWRGAEEEGGGQQHGGGGGKDMAASPLAVPPPPAAAAANLVHGGGGGEGFLAFLGRMDGCTGLFFGRFLKEESLLGVVCGRRTRAEVVVQ